MCGSALLVIAIGPRVAALLAEQLKEVGAGLVDRATGCSTTG